jgi:hypothetical protein
MRGEELLGWVSLLIGLSRNRKAKRVLASAPDAILAREAFVTAFREGTSYTLDPGQVQRLGMLLGLE